MLTIPNLYCGATGFGASYELNTGRREEGLRTLRKVSQAFGNQMYRIVPEKTSTPACLTPPTESIGRLSMPSHKGRN